MGWITIAQAAENTGRRYQVVRGWAKSNKIKSKGNLVDEEEVASYASTSKRQVVREGGGRKELAEDANLPVKKGDMISWNPRISRGKFHDIKGGVVRKQAVVTDVNRLIVEMQEAGAAKHTWPTASLKERIDAGEIAIERPIALMQLICKQWMLQGKEDQARALAAFVNGTIVPMERAKKAAQDDRGAEIPPAGALLEVAD